MCKINHYIFFLFILLAGISQAQLPDQLNFRTITEKDGLSNQKVTCIAQDKNGIMWIGTSNGLNRYDGVRVKSYFTNDAGKPWGAINDIKATEDGLWICTPTQLFYLQTSSEKSWLAGNFTNAIIYKNGWQYSLADHAGIHQLPDKSQIEKKDFQVKMIFKRAKTTPVSNHIVKDLQQQPWSFFKNIVLRLNQKNYAVEQAYSTDGLQIQRIYFDAQNRCWIATWGRGIFLFNPASGLLKQFNVEQNDFVALSFSSWRQAGKNHIVLSSDNSLIMIDEAKLTYKKFTHNGRFRLNTSFEDKDGNLWLACDDGVRWISKRQDLFSVISVLAPAHKADSNWASGVYSIKETASSIWLSKRYFSGIFEYDKSWQLNNYWPQLANSPLKLYKENTSEAYDFLEVNGNMYMTSELGLYVLNRAVNKKIQLLKPDSNQLPRLRNIQVENDSTWWIRSYNNGIYVFDPQQQKFVRHYPVLNERLELRDVHYMLLTKNSKVLLTTFEGLYVLNSNQKFTKLPVAGVPSAYMLGMAEDENGIVWIGSAQGMFAFDPTSEKVVKVFHEYGEMGFCYRVTIDQYNNVWFNCQQGYWCWVQSKQQMLKFGYDMGLPDNRIEAGFTTGKDGTVYAGANDAVVKFDPSAIMQYQANAPAIITDVLANNVRTITHTTNDSTIQLELEAGSYNVALNFSVTDYTTPGNYDMYYQIEPGNKNWSLAEQGMVNFSSLGHGSYRVAVKGSNQLTGSFSRSYFLLLNIRPHWHQTLLFKLTLLGAIFAVTLLVVKRRIKQVRTEAQYKQKIAESKMSVLRSQMNPHFIFNSLNSIENFILQNEQRHASDYLTKFSKLIRTILEINQLQLIPFEKDMEALNWYIELEQVRFPQKFIVNLQIDPVVVTGNFHVPPMIVQPFIENAIVHGIAQSKHNGHQLNIHVTLKGDYLHYLVEDDGIGMERSAAIKQLNKLGHKSVGLQISKERIRLHNKSGGEDDIVFMQKQPTGTRVAVKIKVKNNGST